MKRSGERYSPHYNLAFGLDSAFNSYEHWHRYCYAAPFTAGKIVLDIASGDGYGSAYLAAHAAQVYGVDVSEEAVQHARQVYPRANLRFLRGSAGDIPIPGQHCFDVIVSFETIEHLNESTQERFAREVKRLLKPNGILLISTPNRTVYSEEAKYNNPYHLREFNQEEFVQFLGSYFEHVEMLSQYIYPVSYIWNLDARSTTRTEHQLFLDGNQFRIRQTDGKKTHYMIAVCTDRQITGLGCDSLLIDLSKAAFHNAPDRERWHLATLYLDSGFGFRAEELVQEGVRYGPDFSVTYTLDPSVPYRQLRWDPVEARLCTVRLRRVRWQDDAGDSHELALDRITSNGKRLAEGAFRFETGDPMLFFPIAGAVANLTIEGECVVENEAVSLQTMEALLARRPDELLREMDELLGEAGERTHWHGSTLFLDSGFGFRAEELVSEQVKYGPDFSVTYTLDPSVPYRQLRWDPVEARLCTVRLRRVRWQDDAGDSHELALDRITSNGKRLAKGAFRFETGDPMLFFPIASAVANVTIEGECVVENETASFLTMEALLARRNSELQEVRKLLEVRERHLQECQQYLQEVLSGGIVKSCG